MMPAKPQFLIIFLVVRSCHQFSPPKNNLLEPESSLSKSQLFVQISNCKDDGTPNTTWSRRKTLQSLCVTASGLYVPFKANAFEVQTSEGYLASSLDDLPPISADYVRLFICRHGQTENNRLQKVQGARLDPDINENGREQAWLLGKALSHAPSPPTHIYHSPLKRAQQTATLAASKFDGVQPPTSQLDDIQEIDFGAAAEIGRAHV